MYLGCIWAVSRLMPWATLSVDRHYNSLRPSRKGEFNIYAVLKSDNYAVRYGKAATGYLIGMVPHRQGSIGKPASDVGRRTSAPRPQALALRCVE